MMMTHHGRMTRRVVDGGMISASVMFVGASELLAIPFQHIHGS